MENEENALKVFSDSGSGFVDRELFIMYFNTKTGKITAPNNPSFRNTDIRTIEGLGQKFYDTATTLSEDGAITKINYKYPMREGGEPVPKEMFVTRVGNQGCGTMLFDRSKTD